MKYLHTDKGRKASSQSSPRVPSFIGQKIKSIASLLPEHNVVAASYGVVIHRKKTIYTTRIFLIENILYIEPFPRGTINPDTHQVYQASNADRDVYDFLIQSGIVAPMTEEIFDRFFTIINGVVTEKNERVFNVAY